MTKTMTKTLITIEAFAKVNFTLEVFAKRADGYHALRSLVVPICLSDSLTIEFAEGITSDLPYVDDLCVKAAKVLRDSAPQPECLRGVRISVKKRIPAGGGLGGGSADAAAVLVALNEMWSLNLSPERLAEIGAQVGSDVPALVLARFVGPVVMEGRGEIVRSAGLEGAKCFLVIANPGVFCSTPEVFKKCISRVTDDPLILYNIVSSFAAGDIGLMAQSFMNDLECPAVELHPRIGILKERLERAGAQGAAMSGSGSTLFGLVRSEEEGRAIAASLCAEGFKAWCVATYCPVV